MNVQNYIYEGSVVFTVTTNGYKFLTWNLWLHVKKLNVPWTLLILCLDKESHKFFQQIAMIPSVLVPDVQLSLLGDSTKVSQYGTGDFNRITRQKLQTFTTLLGMPSLTTVLYLDSDIVLFRDPLSEIRGRLSEETPLWFQCDEHNESFTCSSENQGDICHNCCTGVIGFWLGSTPRRQEMLRLVHYEDEIWKQCKQNNDQEYIQKRLSHYETAFSILPRTLYPNGAFLRENKFQSLEAPVLLHFNFLVGGNKQRVIKSKGFWLVPY